MKAMLLRKQKYLQNRGSSRQSDQLQEQSGQPEAEDAVKDVERLSITS